MLFYEFCHWASSLVENAVFFFLILFDCTSKPLYLFDIRKIQFSVSSCEDKTEAQVFQQSSSHLEILGGKQATLCELHTAEPQICSSTGRNLVSELPDAQDLCTPDIMVFRKLACYAVHSQWNRCPSLKLQRHGVQNGVGFPAGTKILLVRNDRLWGVSAFLLPTEYRQLRQSNSRGVKVTCHLYLVSRLRMLRHVHILISKCHCTSTMGQLR